MSEFCTLDNLIKNSDYSMSTAAKSMLDGNTYEASILLSSKDSCYITTPGFLYLPKSIIYEIDKLYLSNSLDKYSIEVVHPIEVMQVNGNPHFPSLDIISEQFISSDDVRRKMTKNTLKDSVLTTDDSAFKRAVRCFQLDYKFCKIVKNDSVMSREFANKYFDMLKPRALLFLRLLGWDETAKVNFCITRQQISLQNIYLASGYASVDGLFENTAKIPEYLNPDHPDKSSELIAAVTTWNAMIANQEGNQRHTLIQRAKALIPQKFPYFKGNPKAVQRIATVCNPDHNKGCTKKFLLKEK